MTTSQYHRDLCPQLTPWDTLPTARTSSSWNPFKRNRLKKREKALREYLYTTPMIFQYPGAFAVAQPGQNLVQPGIPQVHSAMPVSAIGRWVCSSPGHVRCCSNGCPNGLPGSPPGAPAQAMQTAYPAFDYSAYTRPRGDPAPVVPRRSHRSQRHRHDRRHHRSRRRTPSPSTESSNTESESSSYASPSSQESPTYPRHSHRHHRSNSNGYNPLPRPPKDVLASTPFRGILSQLPSAHYTPWGVSNEPTVAMPVPQTFDDRPRTERGGFFRRRKRNDNRTTPSLSAAAGMLAQPFLAPAGMGMPEPQFAPPGAGAATPSFVPPVIPSGSQMRMPSPEPYPSGAGGPPGPSVIPQNTSMQMPSPAPAGATPFIGQGLATPMGSAPPPPGQTMPISMTASPSGGPVPMPTPLVGGSMPMPMPSPMAGGGPAPMPVPRLAACSAARPAR
ncbi:hypothetical protein BC834DRAFT_157012 [Gloeopeniophorella convolvens]|nr:hypothetical protein BC834DRAFT_157012 [Gloeopeniophorella convolvens]